MKKYLFMAVAAIAALSSCSSDNEVFNSEVETALTFTATMEGIGGDTRTTFNATDKWAEWEAGDEIMVVSYDFVEDDFAGGFYTAQSTGPTTTFKASMPGVEVMSGADLYEASFMGFMEMDEEVEGLIIPAKITASHDKFNMPMYAVSENTELNFQNQFSILKVSVASDVMESVKSIKISSSNKALSGIGSFAEVYEGKYAAHLDNDDDPAQTFTVEYTSAVATSSTGTEFYIPVIPSLKKKATSEEYDFDPYKDLKIELSADGTNFTKSMTTKKADGVTIERNKIYNITFKDNSEPTTGKATAKINGEDVEVNWVQLWKDGPKFAEYNIGSTVEKIDGIDMEFSDAIKTGDNYAWGANWRTPNKDEMDELSLAACENSDARITCKYEQVGEIWGFTFTGKEAGYTGNQVFFPGTIGHSDSDGGWGKYWSCTENGSTAWLLYLSTYIPSCGWQNGGKSYGFFVRPVLNEAK